MPEGWRPAVEWSPPDNDVIDVWRLDLTVLEDDWDLLSPDESERASRIVIEEKRDQKAAGRAQLRRILARYLDADPKSLRFEYGEHGKPGLAENLNPKFNLSHSARVGLVGVTRDVRIGVDVEQAREGRAFSDLAQRFFSAAESTVLETLPDSDRPTAFYRTWTRKEAYLKAHGTGLSFPSNAFTIEYATEGPGQLVATEMPGDDPAVWRFADVELGADFAGAICFEGPERPIRWWQA